MSKLSSVVTMAQHKEARPAGAAAPNRLLRCALLVLLGEKIVQHVFVSLALWFDWWGIGATVAVSPTVLAILGAVAAVLFAVALWGVFGDKHWATALVAVLALFDIAGEFVAQGTLAITLNVSFLVATALLVLAFFNWRRLAARRRGLKTAIGKPS